MRFDFAVGNPPYHAECGGSCSAFTPVYHLFMEQTYAVSDVIEVVTPARFLFNAGMTPKAWNTKMLHDVHLKVPYYADKSAVVFEGVDLRGGVAVTHRNSLQEYGAIGVFIRFPELVSIIQRMRGTFDRNLGELVSARGVYALNMEACQAYSDKLAMRDRHVLTSNAFDKYAFVFHEEEPTCTEGYAKIIGRCTGARSYRWVKSAYLTLHDSFEYFKVFLPDASHELTDRAAQLISYPILGRPFEGCTETYRCIGAFETEQEASACMKYIQTRFVRALLGALKTTQHMPRETWAYVPMQDFTESSDIDWSDTVNGVDRQLYRKYMLTDREIAFIETHLKEMG